MTKQSFNVPDTDDLPERIEVRRSPAGVAYFWIVLLFPVWFLTLCSAAGIASVDDPNAPVRFAALSTVLFGVFGLPYIIILWIRLGHAATYPETALILSREGIAFPLYKSDKVYPWADIDTWYGGLFWWVLFGIRMRNADYEDFDRGSAWDNLFKTFLKMRRRSGSISKFEILFPAIYLPNIWRLQSVIHKYKQLHKETN